jgi:hypothetical protein
MPQVLVATGAGCMTFNGGSEGQIDFAGLLVRAIVPDGEGGCLAVVGGNEIWRRSARGQWTLEATVSVDLEAIISIGGKIFAAVGEAGLVRIGTSWDVEPLTGFDTVEGRSQWFAQGPPLHIRALTATADDATILAAVHVGGIPRSTDGGATWDATVPIDFDIHEVRAHQTLPNVVAAAAAVGLCVSQDAGKSWDVISSGPEDPHSLSVAALEREMLFSVQDGPFATRSQVWRWRIGESEIEQVRDGLPEWFSGKVDTGHMGAGNGRAAIVDGGGNLWLSKNGSSEWERIATQVPYVFGMLVL